MAPSEDGIYSNASRNCEGEKRDAEDVVPYKVYMVSFAIRIGATKSFPSRGMVVTVTLRVTVTDEVSRERFQITKINAEVL